MTDKELLELAAKAAGIELAINCNQEQGWKDVGGSGWFEWNPLTDDGDALRLAVKLGISIEEALGWYYGDSNDEEYKSDPYTATRRAIVRAAAEIGKESK